MTVGYKIHNYPDYNCRCRRKDLPYVPVVPKTRTVTLAEYSYGINGSDRAWTTVEGGRLLYTGRTCEVEVPE